MSINDHGLGKREVAAISVFFFLFFAGFALFFVFVPIFLHDRGLSFSQIAVLLAAAWIMGALVQVRLGHLSDAMGSRKGLAAVACISLCISYVLCALTHSFWWFLLLFLWNGIGYSAMLTIPQAIITDWTSASGSTARAFAVTRMWGTIGAGLVLIAAISWPSIVGDARFLYCAAGLYLSCALPMLVVREADILKTTHSMLKGAIVVLRSHRVYVLLLCYALFRICGVGSLNYLGLYIEELGGGTRDVAIAFVICLGAEIPVVLVAGRLSDRLGRKSLLILAFALRTLQLYLYSLAGVSSSVFYIMPLQGITWGIVLVVAVAYISDISPPDLRGTAQSLLICAHAAGMATGLLVVGFLGDVVGLAAAYRAIAIIGAVSLVLLVAFVNEPQPTRKAD